jgi:phosphatidylglycerol:prolipoprotein diacylglycerol transferase
MHPILVRLGPITIHYYGLMYVMAFSIGFLLLAKEVRRKDIPLSTEGLLDLLLWTVPTAIVGARLYYVVFQWDYYGGHPLDILKIWQGGLAIHGGVLAGALTAYVFARLKHVSFWALTDALAPSLILGQAIGRVGNLMNGDAFGTPTSLPWGIRFPPDSPAGMAYPGVATHPSMIYEMLLNLMVFAYLWKIRNRAYKDGFSTAAYFILYAVARSIVSFTRGDSLWLGPIRAAHAISAGFVVLFGGLIWIRRLYERSPTVGTSLPGTPAERQDR